MPRCSWTAAFTLDLRSLAAMRIVSGLLVIWDLFVRASDFSSHFARDAVFPVEFSRRLEQLPRAALGIREPASALLSLHNLSGAAWWQGLLFGLTFLALLGYTVGLRTRLSAFISLILIMSMHNRNIMMLYPGDDFSRLILFFACFLPCGQIWSLDARNDKITKPHYFEVQPSLYSAGYVLILVIYFSLAGLTKTGAAWREGLGVYYMLSREGWTTGLGDPLLSQLWLLRLLNELTWYGESLLPLLVLVPWRNHLWRSGAILIYMIMLINFRLFLNIYHVSHLAVAFWIGALPGVIWDRYMRQPGGAAPVTLGAESYKNNPVLQAGFLLMILLMIWSDWNRAGTFIKALRPIPMPESIRKLALFTYAANPWRGYFVDTRKLQDGWVVARGHTHDGTRDLNLNTGAPFTLDKPRDFVASSGGFRWWRFYYRVYTYPEPAVRALLIQRIADYYCKRAISQGLEAVEILLMELPLAEPYAPRPGPIKKVLAARSCTPES